MNLDKPDRFSQDIFALIPARSGSKGILRKNLETIEGKSLVQITIEKAKTFIPSENIYVSTDSHEIAKIAEKSNVKFVYRSEQASSDTASANDVVSEFLNYFDSNLKKNLKNLIIIYLQPTSPFRSKNLISTCLRIYMSRSRPVVTVREVNDHPEKMVTIEDRTKVREFNNFTSQTVNRQDLEKLYIASGSVYIFSSDDFQRNDQKIPIIDSIPVIVNNEEMLDIDDAFDLQIARLIGTTYEF